MTNFIRDNTSPGDPKTDYRTTSIPASQKFAAVDYERFRQALLDIQTYLRSGLLDAAPTTTVASLDVVNNASPSVNPAMDFVGYDGKWLVAMDLANAPTSRDFVPVAQKLDYSFSDAVTTSGSATLTSASQGGFAQILVGTSISGAGIPNGTTVSAVGGTTSLTMSANATATASSVRVRISSAITQDFEYWRHRGALSPTLGIGVTPPDGSARLQVAAADSEPAMGTVRLRRGPSQTGNVLTLHDSAPTDRVWVDKDFYFSGSNAGGVGGAFAIAADGTNQRSLMMTGSDKVTLYGFSHPTGSGGVLRLSCISGGNTIADFSTDGSARFLQAVRTSASLRFDSELSPSSIGSDQNDYNPGSLANAAVLMLTSSLAVNLTGLTSGSVSGRTLWVYNVGASNITLKHQNASSTAANRFIGRGGADTVLTPNTGAQLFWSSSQTRWLILGDTL